MTAVTAAAKTSSRSRFSPYAVAVPIEMTIFAFYARQFLPYGVPGIVGGALVGALWALLLGFIAQGLARRAERLVLLANAPVFLAILAMGLSVGGSLMYGFMLSKALDEPSTTYAVLSALMQPAVPYYIILNSAMELFLVSLVVFWNWNTSPTRRALLIVGVLVYFVMRIWTYLVYAEARVALVQRPLSPADVEWFKQTLENDYRVVLSGITYVCLLFAAFVPVRSQRKS